MILTLSLYLTRLLLLFVLAITSNASAKGKSAATTSKPSSTRISNKSANRTTVRQPASLSQVKVNRKATKTNNLNSSKARSLSSVTKPVAKIKKKTPSKKSKELYPIPWEWPTSESCAANQKLNKKIEASPELKLVKQRCTSETKNDPECLVPLFKLAAITFDIDYPLVQCVFGRETAEPSGAHNNVTLLTSDSSISTGTDKPSSHDKGKQNKAPETKSTDIVDYKVGANKGNGKGLGQLTLPAIRAVQELVDPNLSCGKDAEGEFDCKNKPGKYGLERFDCDLYQRQLAFFNALGENIPSILITKDKQKSIAFTEFIASHNIAVSVSYLYDIQQNLLEDSDKIQRKGESDENYRDRIIELTAREYNSTKKGAISYGQGVKTCSQNVRAALNEHAGNPIAISDEGHVLPSPLDNPR